MLAIIIPYYKLTFFEATLQSLAAQTCQDFKVYIGDDASVEDPSMLLEGYKGKFDFVYHRFATNLGGTSLTQQWERCIALLDNEEWLMILGDDDVLGENVVEEFFNNLKEINRKKITIVRYATEVIDEVGVQISGLCVHPTIEQATDFLIKKINKQTRSSLSEYIFDKLYVFKIGFKNFPLGWYSDDIAILDFSNNNLIYTINESKLSIRYSSYSLSGNDSNQKEKDIAKFSFYWILYSQYSERFSTSQMPLLKKKLIDSFFNRIFIKHYLKILYYSLNKSSFGLLKEINCRLLNFFKNAYKTK